MKRILVLVFFITLSSQAQPDFNYYKGLQSEGEMPQAFRKVLALKGDNAIKSVFKSGKILYGTVLNRYVEKILDNLLVNNPSLRSEIAVFIVKSPVVNAYVTEEKLIFVNVGLLAQATNEAEIAFVLAHEMAHIVCKHVPLKTESGISLESYLSKHNRSREQENEADKIGIEKYYSASKYSYQAIDGAFDVLQYSYLPFDNIPFKRSEVETDFYSFPDSYFLTNINPIRSREDYVDTLSTHPNILKRRTAAKHIYGNRSDEGRSLFIQDEDLFKQVRMLARLESIHQYLIYHSYGNAYYNAYLMLQEMPDNVFLFKAKAISLYGLSKHKKDGSLWDVITKPAKVEGEKQQLHHFLGETNRKELNVLALRFLWQAHKTQPEDASLLAMCEDAIRDMISSNKLKLSDFSDYGIKDTLLIDTLVTEEIDTSVVKSKYDRIKTASSKKVKPLPTFQTVNYMLVDLKQDNEFVKLVEEISMKIEDEMVLQVIDTKGKMVDPSKGIFIWEPSYYYVKKEKLVDSKSFKGKKNIAKALTLSAKRLKFSYQIFNGDRLQYYTTEEYNHFCEVKDWMQDLFSISADMIAYRPLGEDNHLSQNCQYILFTSTVERPDKFVTYLKCQDLALSLLCPISIPMFAFKFMLPETEVITSLTVIDKKTNKVMYSSSQSFADINYGKPAMSAFFYDCFYTMKKGGKDAKKKK